MSDYAERIDDATRDQIACLKAALASVTAERDKEIKNRNGWRDAAGSNMKHLMQEIELRDAALVALQQALDHAHDSAADEAFSLTAALAASEARVAALEAQLPNPQPTYAYRAFWKPGLGYPELCARCEKTREQHADTPATTVTGTGDEGIA